MHLKNFGEDHLIIDFEKWLINEFEIIEIEINQTNVSKYDKNIIAQELTDKLNKQGNIGNRVELIKKHLNNQIETLL